MLFLDVAMPEKTGFELLEMLQFIPLIVFVTAYEKYALQALKVSSVDFILKPIDIAELKKVEEKLLLIQAYRKNMSLENYGNVVGNLLHMFHNPGVINKLTLPVAVLYVLPDR